jgi:hypothetical protein
LHLTGVDRLLWALSIVGHCVLLTVLLSRRRAANFPVFTTLIAANIFRSAVLYLTLRFGTTGEYFYTYWTLAIVDAALQLALAFELAAHVFRPLGVWAPDVRRSSVVLVGISLLLAGALTWLASPPTRSLRLAIVIRGDLFSSALVSELFVWMVALSVTLGLPWRTHAARLAQGLGVYSICGILVDAAHTYFGSMKGNASYRLTSRLQIVLYLLCVTYWIASLAMDEPKPRKLPAELHAELVTLQRRAALMLRSLRAVGSAI